MRQYPVSEAATIPCTGQQYFHYLIDRASEIAPLGHTAWYEGEAAKLKQPDVCAFRGDIPRGQSLELIALGKTPLDGGRPVPYTFTGKEQFVLVSNLSEQSMELLHIPKSAPLSDKVYNSNFKPFGKLGHFTQASNLAAARSVPMAISHYHNTHGKPKYSERNILHFLETCLDDLSGEEMSFAIYSNHTAWMGLSCARGELAGDAASEFDVQTDPAYFMKDAVTIMPTMLYAMAHLGQDPVPAAKRLQREIEFQSIVAIAERIQENVLAQRRA
jgi:hypothetical protein